MKKNILILILITGAFFCAYGQDSTPIDLILLLDTSSGMSSSNETVNNYITGAFLSEFLRVGDTFHLIAFSGAPRLDIARRVSGRGDVETIVGRMLLQYPVESGNDARAAISFAEEYASALPSRPKKIVMISTGSSDINSLVSAASQRLASKNTSLDFVPVTPGQPLANLPMSGRPAASTAQRETSSPAPAQAPSPATTAQTPSTTQTPPPVTTAQTPSTTQTPSPATTAQTPSTTQTPPPATTAQTPSTTQAPPSPATTAQTPSTTQAPPPPATTAQTPSTTQAPPPPATTAQTPSTTQTPSPATTAQTPSSGTQPAPVTGSSAAGGPDSSVPAAGASQTDVRDVSPPADNGAGVSERPGASPAAEPEKSQKPAAVTRAVSEKPVASRESRAFSPLIIGIVILALLVIGLIIFFVLRRLGSSPNRVIASASSPPESKTKKNEEPVPFVDHSKDLASYAAVQTKQRITPYKDRSVKTESVKPPVINPSGPLFLNLFVEDQNTAIGKRNIHSLKSGYSLTVGGGGSDFLIFLVPIPSKIGEIRRDGSQCNFVPRKPKYFPDLGSNVLRDCINKTIRIISDKNYELRFRFEMYEDPLIELNRVLHSVKVPG